MREMKRLLKLIFITLLLPVAAFAQNDALEDEANDIESRLVAPCCWTYPVSDHSSPDALQIKQEVRNFLSEGKSKAEIFKFYEEKFGERILTDPKRAGFNIMLWVLPPLFLILGLYVVVRFLSRKSQNGGPANEAEAEMPKADPASDEEYRKQIQDELYRPS